MKSDAIFPDISAENSDEFFAIIANLRDQNSFLETKASELETKTYRLETKTSELETKTSELETKTYRLEIENSELREKIRIYQHALFAKQAEKVEYPSLEQGEMFNEAEATPVPKEEIAKETITYQRNQSVGRKSLPAHFPRREVIIDEGESCPDCQSSMPISGRDIAEKLNIVPAKFEVIKEIRIKRHCTNCPCDKDGNYPSHSPKNHSPIPGSIATAQTLSFIACQKFQYSLPLYRLEDMMTKAGLALNRGTMASWMMKMGDLVAPLLVRLKEKLLESPLIHGDETTMRVLKDGKVVIDKTSYVWVYRTDAFSENSVILMDYQFDRKHERATGFLNGYQGTIMSDGYAAWHQIEGVTNLGCWAHARRKFFEALIAQEKSRKKHEPPIAGESLAKQALDQIGKLYEIEKVIKDWSLAARADYRKQFSKPLLVEFKAWLDQHSLKQLKGFYLGKAIKYALGQWRYLEKYAEDGRMPIDNNLIERDIRPFVTGRKNWLFASQVKGAQASANLYSLILTCRANGIDPSEYLTKIFTHLPKYIYRDQPLLNPPNIPDNLLPFKQFYP